jgi:catechol 2,3-dioxygenase-like lactoylglutathione lyase family enzyme
MLGVRHLALRVRDLKRSLDFYTRIMNMRVEWQPDADNAYLTSGSDNLALHQVSSASGAGETGGAALDHFGFLVATPDEVDGWARDLEARGVALEQQPKTHRDGARSIYFRDPDGNLIQLLYHPPISRAVL